MTWQRHPYFGDLRENLSNCLVLAIHIPGIPQTTFIKLKIAFLVRKPSRIRMNPGTQKSYIISGT